MSFKKIVALTLSFIYIFSNLTFANTPLQIENKLIVPAEYIFTQHRRNYIF